MQMSYLFLLMLLAMCCGCVPNKGYFSFNKDIKIDTLREPHQIKLDNYIIGTSDGLEIQYYTDAEFRTTDYTIDTEDKLRIDFSYYPELSRTVQVRPDGFITLARIGEIRAVGERPRVLGEKISKLYSAQLLRPIVSVEIVEFNSKIKDLKEAVSTANRGQSKYVVVRPDGKISLPYLQDDIIAAGKTALSLSRELESQYRKNVKNISITVSVLEAKSYQACIVGDVKEAGCYTLAGPTMFLQFVSRSGGFTKEANLHQIILISRNEKKYPKYKILDAEKIIYNSTLEPIVQQYDVIYVPRVWLSEVALTIDTIWKIIPVVLTANIYER